MQQTNLLAQRSNLLPQQPAHLYSRSTIFAWLLVGSSTEFDAKIPRGNQTGMQQPAACLLLAILKASFHKFFFSLFLFFLPDNVEEAMYAGEF